MGDALAVCRVQRRSDLLAVLQDVVKREWTLLEAIGERFALEVLHDQVVQRCRFSDVEERADVRVAERRDRPGLAVEALQELLVLREPGGEHLDRDVPAEARVARAPDFAHAAGAERSCDLVRSQALTRR